MYFDIVQLMTFDIFIVFNFSPEHKVHPVTVNQGCIMGFILVRPFRLQESDSLHWMAVPAYLQLTFNGQRSNCLVVDWLRCGQLRVSTIFV